MSRWKAASIHLAISITLLASIAALLSATWYPPMLLNATGGLGIIAILAGVDACIGPLLTLIVYKHGKPGLIFDLCAIAVAQILALSYGLHVAYLARPVYLVFTVDRFELVSAGDVSPENLQKASRPEFLTLPLFGPQIIAAQLPAGSKENESIMFSALSTGTDLQHLPQYYVPYAEGVGAVVKKSLPIDKLLQHDEQSRTFLLMFIADRELDQDKVKFVPLRTKINDETVLIEAGTGKFLGIVNVNPWPQ